MDETVSPKKTWNLRTLDVETPAADNVLAWEMIEAGRYMPRRTRGSFPGRELG